MSEPRKPLAEMLTAEKESAIPEREAPADEEMMLAEDAAAALGAKDPQAAAGALVDVIRACMAKQRKGGYEE